MNYHPLYITFILSASSLLLSYLTLSLSVDKKVLIESMKEQK